MQFTITWYRKVIYVAKMYFILNKLQYTKWWKVILKVALHTTSTLMSITEHPLNVVMLGHIQCGCDNNTIKIQYDSLFRN